MNKKEYEEFVKKHYKKIFNFIYKILRSYEDSEDILQNVFIIFYNKRNKIKEESCLSYLYKIAYSKSLNHLNKNKKKNKNEISFNNAINYHTLENGKKEKQNFENLEKSISQLPEKMAIIIDLKYYQKKNYSEIAKILSTTVSAIDSLLVRAKKKLRKNLQNTEKKLS